LKAMCYRTACIALVVSTLNTKLASPVSLRDALYAELASLARKSINTPVRLVDRDRIGENTVRTENSLLILVTYSLPTYT
jgi:hypothetical protein